jgi:hypothetical protein
MTGGYNVNVDAPPTEVNAFGFNTDISIGQEARKIVIDALPGLGLGEAPGCPEPGEAVDLKTINGQPANAAGNFTLSSSGCSAYVVAILPDPEKPPAPGKPDDYKFGVAGMADSEGNNRLIAKNNCKPCYDCSYFIQTYRGLARQHAKYRTLAQYAEITGGAYKDNRELWIEEKTIRERENLKIALRSDGKCKVSWAVSFCNTTKQCLTAHALSLIWLLVDAQNNPVFSESINTQEYCPGVEAEIPGVCGSIKVILRPDKNFEDLTQSVIRYDFNASKLLNAQETAYYRGRVKFPDCDTFPEGTRLRVLAYVSAFTGETGEIITYRTQADRAEFLNRIPENVRQAINNSGQLPVDLQGALLSDELVVNDRSPYCYTCN